MGADMIGYQTMFPVKFTEDEAKKLNKHLDDVEKLLKTPNLAQLITLEDSAEDTYLKQLNELLSELPEEIERDGIHDDEDEIKNLIEAYSNLIPYAREFIKEPHISERDSSTRIYNILGRKFQSVFAGEMSWGDEPQGGGYEILKNLDKIGILWMAEARGLAGRFTAGESDCLRILCSWIYTQYSGERVIGRACAVRNKGDAYNS